MDAEISPGEVDDLLDADEDVRVVDIRPEAEFERGHIPDSENIPFHALADEIDRLDGADRVVTVCPHGQASVQAARLIASYEGVPDDARIESMAGGLDAWERDLETADSGTGPGNGENGRDGESPRDDANSGDGENAETGGAEGPEAPF